jgi:hypothetical protein
MQLGCWVCLKTKGAPAIVALELRGVPLRPVDEMCACRRAHSDRQQVSAGARASWIGGRRRPTHGIPTCSDSSTLFLESFNIGKAFVDRAWRDEPFLKIVHCREFLSVERLSCTMTHWLATGNKDPRHRRSPLELRECHRMEVVGLCRAHAGQRRRALPGRS